MGFDQFYVACSCDLLSHAAFFLMVNLAAVLRSWHRFFPAALPPQPWYRSHIA
jgi:hypothetical protein